MTVDLDIVVFAVAVLGFLMAIGSAWNAAIELYECQRSDPPVNGATHLSAIALEVKAILMVVAMGALASFIRSEMRVPGTQVTPTLFVAVLTLTGKVVYDYFFHIRLYAMVRPEKDSPRRRTSD